MGQVIPRCRWGTISGCGGVYNPCAHHEAVCWYTVDADHAFFLSQWVASWVRAEITFDFCTQPAQEALLNRVVPEA